MLDLLDNLPRLRLSDDQLKAIIWVMRECCTPNVPSFSALRKMQASLTKQVDIIPQLHTSLLGNHFYMNHPAKLLSLVSQILYKIEAYSHFPQDWGNPLVRDSIHVYPEVSGPVSESWQAGKWLQDVDPDELSPMWADWKDKPHLHYYIKELAQLNNGKFVIPMRWITVNKVVHAEVFDVVYNEEVRVPLFHDLPLDSHELK